MELHIYHQATQLLSRLYGALDKRDYETVARCFHANGQWQRQGKLLQGRNAMVNELQRRSTTLVVHHLYNNCLFECLTQSRLKVRYLLTAFLAYPGLASIGGMSLTAASPQIGFCEAEFLEEGGEWLLTSMAAHSPTFKAGTA